MGNGRVWLEAARPKTLPAAVAPVLLGSGAAGAVGAFELLPALICLAFALLIQIGTNFANDYLDARSGADRAERAGPARAVASGAVAPGVMRGAAVGTLALAFAVGLGLIPFGGWWLLGVGVASVACAWLYTGGPYPLAHNGLGDVFVVLFIGLVAVGCTFYVQTGTIGAEIVWLGLGCGLLTNNILVVNNYRDAPEDAEVGKRTLVVRFGRGWALRQYALSVAVAGGVVLWFLWRGYGWPVAGAFVPLVAAVRQIPRLARAERPEDYLAALRVSGRVVAGYGVLFAAALAIGNGAEKGSGKPEAALGNGMDFAAFLIDTRPIPVDGADASPEFPQP